MVRRGGEEEEAEKIGLKNSARFERASLLEEEGVL
jgi:hypothetical protein